eukprot:CAMPEP_0202760580 /NCGR_PEP_ID=MMETSP1388-20130828/18477_1 /ASSEMBLY_ACC=CAM_ASM_000864 /TAXON_ID=37098 /ORGANISM="Isochrysis sp, Strain CCMP1244" /LENGTH=293 /DNA_ID=CAMNT_0049428631 /DNA_START=100 /DNA_END=983 /DNA_ORIENTATION=-
MDAIDGSATPVLASTSLAPREHPDCSSAVPQADSTPHVQLVSLSALFAAARHAEGDDHVPAARVLRGLRHGEAAPDALVLLHGQRQLAVEEDVPPVRRLCVGRSAQPLPRDELDGEVADEAVQLRAHVATQVEARAEGLAVGQVAAGEVPDVEHAARRRDHVLRQQQLDLRPARELRASDRGEAAHVDAVDIRPERLMLLGGLLVPERSEPHLRPPRQHAPSGLEPAVARSQHGVEHRLVEQEAAHPLGDNHVDALGSSTSSTLPRITSTEPASPEALTTARAHSATADASTA